MVKSAIESVLAQTYKSYEIIAVDDGSTDESLKVLQSYVPRIKVLKQANTGPGVARNFAARESKGAYLAFLDSDDLWFPWTLSVYEQALRKHKHPNIASGEFLLFHDRIEVEKQLKVTLQTTFYTDFLSATASGLCMGAGQTVIRREIFLQAEGFTNSRVNLEDHDLALRLGSVRGYLRITQPVLIGYRQHKDGIYQNPEQNLKGAIHLLMQEKKGIYPGGFERKNERWKFISQQVRPITVQGLKAGFYLQAWRIYSAMFWYHLRNHKLKFIFGFLVLLGFSWCGFQKARKLKDRVKCLLAT